MNSNGYHSMKAIPVYDPLPEVEALWPELEEAFRRVMHSGQYILGPEVEAFEQEVALWSSPSGLWAWARGTR